jgi:hypothetical protein
MKGRVTHTMRELLRRYPDGLTTVEAATYTGISYDNTKRVLADMPDVYIDRWVLRDGPGREPWRCVWCAVDVPDNCPKPE